MEVPAFFFAFGHADWLRQWKSMLNLELLLPSHDTSCIFRDWAKSLSNGGVRTDLLKPAFHIVDVLEAAVDFAKEHVTTGIAVGAFFQSTSDVRS